MREEVWVGIELGKAGQHGCAVDVSGRAVFSQKVTNGEAAIELSIARAVRNAREVSWSVDMTTGSAGLLLVLLASAQPVV